MDKDRRGINLNFRVSAYIRYLRQRRMWINNKVLLVEQNESNYVNELYKYIIQYGKHHILYFKYLFENLTFDELGCLLGINVERSLWRYIEKQRNDLVKYITDRELDLFVKYPYKDGTQQLTQIVEG